MNKFFLIPVDRRKQEIKIITLVMSKEKMILSSMYLRRKGGLFPFPVIRAMLEISAIINFPKTNVSCCDSVVKCFKCI